MNVDAKGDKLDKKPMQLTKWKRASLYLAAVLVVSAAVSVCMWAIITGGFVFAQGSEIKMFALFAGVAVMLVTLLGYIVFLRNKFLSNVKSMVIVFSVTVVTLLLAVGMSFHFNVYVVPISISALLIGLTVDKRIGIISNFLIGLIMLLANVACKDVVESLALSESAVAVCVSTISGFLMMFLIKRNFTRFKFTVRAVLVSALTAPVAALASMLYAFDATEIIMSGVWCMTGNLIAVIITSAIMPLFEYVFNIPTDFRLAELCSFAQPLMKKLSSQAPGTFQHSIMVGNLSEACALAIGENPHLARACAFYHDVGKLNNPDYFVENQSPDYNPHTELIPEVSANIITKHTKDGYDILRQARFPEEVALVALEHHGDAPVGYFYMQAQNITEGELDSQNYRYNNPKPSTKIAAIVMIADTVEAASRTLSNVSGEDLKNFIHSLIHNKMELGEFIDCSITMKDLDVIEKTLLRILPASFHNRIKYPKRREA